jgi:DNA modification methylase
MTLNREYIANIKTKGNGELAKLFDSIKNNNVQLRYTLENLGYLPKNFDINLLRPFIENKNDNIRFWVVKNIGKVATEEYIRILGKVAKEDSNSMVRREAVSSLGRMRNSKAIKTLLKFLNDNDPKIVAQALRGLLVFKRLKSVSSELMKLKNHPNEMIQKVIQKEFFSFNNKKKEDHKIFPQYLKDTVVCGDVREILNFVPDESIHLTFTSPPYYNARDYSIYKSYKEYLEFLNEVFKEVHRITKEGRFFILNTSPVIIPRVSRQHSSIRYPITFDIHKFIIDIGWEFIDDIIWVKPEVTAKNRNAGFLQHRKPLAYKPNPITEYLMVYRKKTEKLIDWNIKQYNWDIIKSSKVDDGFETSNVWRIEPTFSKHHEAVFPLELCTRVIKYYSFKGDLVFDPFAGSGTFGIAASLLNRHFFLTEKDEKYFNVIQKNIEKQKTFFENTAHFFSLIDFQNIPR